MDIDGKDKEVTWGTQDRFSKANSMPEEEDTLEPWSTRSSESSDPSLFHHKRKNSSISGNAKGKISQRHETEPSRTSLSSSKVSYDNKSTNMTVELEESSSLFPSMEVYHDKGDKSNMNMGTDTNTNKDAHTRHRRRSSGKGKGLDNYAAYNNPGGLNVDQIPVLGHTLTGGTDNIDAPSLFGRAGTEHDEYDQSDDNSNDNEDSENDDIRSSILHRILDNESFANDINHDKMFYSKLYSKYDNKRPDSDSLEITDFAQYNKMLMKEERLRQKLEIVAKRKGKNLGRSHQGDNVLTTLNEKELEHIFARAENPKDWNEVEYPRSTRHKKSIFKNLLRPSSSSHKNYSETANAAASNEEKKYPYVDYVSTLSSIPIDDDIGLEDLPIDSQPFRKIRPPVNSDHFPFDVEMVVSGQDKVDYDFHRIDQYQNIDPAEVPGSEPPNRFSRFLHSINLLRIIRIQRANRYQIQRKLNVRHLHQIALGGTLGVGLLLSSGKAFTIAGPLGALLGFVITGFIVIATMLSFCEIVTLIPLCGGVSGIASRFVDDAFGFSLGVVYWVTYMVSFPSEITASSIMLSFYQNLDVPGPRTAGWITLFFSFTLMINLFDIRVYGEFEYYSTIVKLMMLVGLMIYMIILNRGGSPPLHEKIGFKYWNSSLSEISEHITFGPFRPTFDIDDEGFGSLNGIGGNTGRFLQVLISSVIASYAYVGTEIVIIAGSESRNPRQAIPSATKNIFYRIVIFYLVAIFLIGLNVYSGDPRLLRYFSTDNTKGINLDDRNKIIELIGGTHCTSGSLDWGGFSNGNKSPWVIAIQSAGLCSFASAVNAFLLYFALTAASSQLYASSRTLYFMAIQNKAPSCFSLCTKRGVPYMSVLFTASFGLLSYLAVQDNTALIFERMVSVCSTAGLLVWSGMCLSFIRFYYALQLRPDIISRNDDDYPYRSPFQPYFAYSGLVLGMVLVFASGFVVFLKNEWSTAFFISSYGSLFLFVLCYVGYKICRGTKMHRLDQVDLDSGRREIDRVIWEDEKNYVSSFKEIFMKGINLLI